MQAGDLVGDRFEIEAAAGFGGMGTVYRARDRYAHRLVALKALRRTEETDVARFAREAEWLAELRHPAIVQYLAHGVTDEGAPYMVMEWLSGEPLSNRLARGPLTPQESALLAATVAEGLALCHERGVIHRDLKPSNLFLVEGDVAQAKIVDFGIARKMSELTELTATGKLIGTWSYMSPEQVQGSRDLDGRADLFSLGCVMFESLTGRRAFPGEHGTSVLAKILLESAPNIRDFRPDLPKPLATIITRLLLKDKEQRPNNAQEVAAALQEIEFTEATSFSYVPPTPSLTHTERRHQWIIAARWKGAMPGERQLHNARNIISRHNGKLGILPNGAWVVTFAGPGSPVDHGITAARCALALHPILAQATIVVGCGMDELQEDPQPTNAIDRVGRALNEAGTDYPYLEEVAARLLSTQFEIREDSTGFSLTREKDPLDQVRSAMVLGVTVPCIGRDRELGILQSTFNECAQEHVSRAVLITGPAGMGKTRILQDFLRWADQRLDETVVLLGHSDPMTRASPFSTLGGAIRRAAAIGEGQPLDARREALRKRIRATFPNDPGKAEQIASILGEIIATPFHTDADSALKKMRDDANLLEITANASIVEWLLQESKTRTVMLVLENAQWADAPTIRAIQTILQSLHNAPVLAIVAGRTELQQIHPFLWDTRNLVEIRLGPLGHRSSRKLVDELLGDKAAAFAQRIIEQSEGNPFLLEELARGVRQGDELPLSETVIGMAHASLDRLDNDARRVLRAASIFGGRFWNGAVQIMVGPSERGLPLGTILENLEKAEIIFRRRQSAFPDQIEYEFRHPILRDAAYALLTDHDRRLGHRLAAEWLLRQGEPDWHVVRSHYERAEANVTAQ